MRTVTINDKLAVTLFDSIKELPANLYQKARQYECMDADLGSSEAERDKLLSQIALFIQTGQKAEAAEGLYNYRLARTLALAGYQPNQLEWACYVQAVNGEPVADYSEEGLEKLIERLSGLGLTQNDIDTLRDEVKKNSNTP